MKEAYNKEIQPLQNKLYNKRSELKRIWLERSPDWNRIAVVETEIRTLREEIQNKVLRILPAFFKILTPEQRTKLQAYGADGAFSSGKGMRDHNGMGAHDSRNGPGHEGLFNIFKGQ